MKTLALITWAVVLVLLGIQIGLHAPASKPVFTPEDRPERKDFSVVFLDATDRRCFKIETRLGVVLARVTQVTPCLDGYIVTVWLGNLYAVDLIQGDLSAHWSTNGVLREGNMRLPAGAWSAFQLPLVPARWEDLQCFWIQFEPKGVSMVNPKSNE